MITPSSPIARKFHRVAIQRFEDAEFLIDKERLNAGVYLAGYVVECMLKAMILCSTPRTKEIETESEFRRQRGHDFGWLIKQYYDRRGARMPPTIRQHFARLNAWSTALRYESGRIPLQDAKAFLASTQEFMIWGEGRLS